MSTINTEFLAIKNCVIEQGFTIGSYGIYEKQIDRYKATVAFAKPYDNFRLSLLVSSGYTVLIEEKTAERVVYKFIDSLHKFMHSLPGWNIRCNVCGERPADWVQGEREGWGALALCYKHKTELQEEYKRHRSIIVKLKTINFEQIPYFGEGV